MSRSLLPLLLASPPLGRLPPLLASPPPLARLPPVRCLAAPRKKGVDSYQTVKVTCEKCGEKLFTYKKKNGLKSNLIKCYIERIRDDPHGLLDSWGGEQMACPKCDSQFARAATIHGRSALKMVGGKVRMKK